MASGQPNGRRDDELFMRRQNTEPETPTVGPLRITKQTPSPSQQDPSGRSNTASPAFAGYGKPTSPPPNRPLPYPDTQRTGSPAANRVPSPMTIPSSSAAPAVGGFQASQPYTYRMPNYPGAGATSPTLAERRGKNGRLKPLPDSPGPETPDKDGAFQRPLKSPPIITTGLRAAEEGETIPSAMTDAAYNFYGHEAPSRPKPGPELNTANIHAPTPTGVNRLASTASVSTTRGTRGSPPPPETPLDFPTNGGGIESRFAAAGIAGPSTLTSLQAQGLASQAQSYAAQQRNAQYSAPPQPQPRADTPPRRPWTPTEEEGSISAHRPLSTFMGPERSAGHPAYQAPNATPPRAPGAGNLRLQTASPPRVPQETPLEQDMLRMNVSDEPPPAYSSLGGASQGYPAEKGQNQQQRQPVSILEAKAQAHAQAQGLSQAGQAAAPGSEVNADGHPQHPAFAHASVQQQEEAGPSQLPNKSGTPGPSDGRTASPPPLPEGWIAHLDPNSGQYYYIHLPTQSTQWEFPKGHTPLNMNDVPASPTGTFVNPFASPAASTFNNPMASPGLQKPSLQPLASPSFGPGMLQRTDSYPYQSMSSPTAAGFSQLPPMQGVEQYRVAPTNGVYFGPYLRYTNTDVDNGVWFGSIMLITDGPNPPTIHLHQSVDLSPDPRQLKANHIHQHKRWAFYRYDVDIHMESQETKWTYAITSHLGCTRYEFAVAGRHESNWRFIAHSGNDFAINVNNNERTKLGGVTHMWKDILQKHAEVGGFHAQLGMGNQIYADRLWKEVPLLRQWVATSGKENRKTAPWTPQHEEDVSHAYFHFYTSHLDQSLLREAFAQIPHILSVDDHDIFDGFGSYPPHLQQSQIIRNLSRVAYQAYLLFQHHTTPEILAHVRDNLDLFTITGTGWHFLKYLGPSVVVMGPDTRSERTQNQVLAGPTYQGLFPKIAMLPPSVQHCLMLLPVPVVYPRLEAAEQFASAFGTGKKVATGTFNALGKVAGGVAGIVGAKGVVREGFDGVKKAVGKSGLMSNVLSPFGEVDVLDELRDQWTHESKDLERTYLIRTLQSIAHQKSLRITFLSGATNCCGIGLLHDPSNPSNHKTMYQIISSSVVNAPPSPYVLRMLHPHHKDAIAPIYLPANGTRSARPGAGPRTDTKEDMLEVFGNDPNNGGVNQMKRLMGRRNYAIFCVFDPEAVEGAFSAMGMDVKGQQPQGAGRVSLAVDLMVQSSDNAAAANMNNGMQSPMPSQASFFPGPSAQSATVKYGPVIVPGLEYGR